MTLPSTNLNSFHFQSGTRLQTSCTTFSLNAQPDPTFKALTSHSETGESVSTNNIKKSRFSPVSLPLLPLNTSTSSEDFPPHIPTHWSHPTCQWSHPRHSSKTSFNSKAKDILDMILSCGIFNVRQTGRIVRHYSPINLSLYELGILVDIVYKEADYQNQCFWFTNMIFDVVEMCYRDANDLDGMGFKVPHEYLPNVAGHWG